jgi:phosphoglycerate dehydrogenase-like enzyme
MSRILVTPRSLTGGGSPVLAPLSDAGHDIVLGPAGRMPTEAELLELVPGCAGWLAGVEPIGAAVLDAASDLRVISRNGVGVDGIDLEAARARGIEVLRAPGANANGVAELALALILGALRSIPAAVAAMRAGRWERELGAEAAGRTLGVVGAGAIGRRVVALAEGIGMQTVATDPFPPTDPPTRMVELGELLEVADVVTLHAPAQPGERPLLGDDELRRLRRGAVLVNTARAALVDDDAVLAALESGRLRAYATDAFDTEPPPPSPLLRHPRVLATPHVGGYTAESVERAASTAVAHLLDVLGAAPAA